MLRSLGADVEDSNGEVRITGPQALRGTRIASNGDHQVEMATRIAALVAEGDTTVEGKESMASSYPAFARDLDRLLDDRQGDRQP
jgi:3-phosphoshikimate 1-carboxyvinyltransferase